MALPWQYAPGDYNFNKGSSSLTQPVGPGPTNLLPGGFDLMDDSPDLRGPSTGGLFGGMNGLDKAKIALGGLQTIGGLWAAFQSAKMAKKQFNFTKKTTEANMANQIQSYNTALADRARSRAVVESQDAATSQAYVDKNKLPAYRG